MTSITTTLFAALTEASARDLDAWADTVDTSWSEDLGHGTTFRPRDTHSYVAVRNGEEIGWVTLFSYQMSDDDTIRKSSVPAIRDILVGDDYRKTGLGRAMVKALVRHIGELRSDPEGVTSEDAARMWDAIGGRKGQRRHGGSFFYTKPKHLTPDRPLGKPRQNQED